MTNEVEIKEEIDENITENEAVKFKGHFIAATGRRKSSVATVRLYKKGRGAIEVNSKKINEYFPGDKANIVKQPLKIAGHLRDLNISILVRGGGVTGQTEAARHAISRALVVLDSGYRPALKTKKYLTRDARVKERKKPGLKKARRAPQWSKR